MGYNTFPTLQGIGWNIKKRQLWSTNVEVAANGAEFRTGYWTSPLYEFDLSINYLSPTDKATLEAFYLQQQGPLIPFLLPIVNEGSVVTDQVFFTGNGTATTASLPIWPATVTAMHQTDWQGRLALSNTPRTNWIPFSAVANNYPAGISIATGQADPKGGTAGVTFTATANQGAGQAGMGVYWVPSSGVPTSGACNWSLWIKASRAGIQLQVGTNSSGSIIIVTTTGAWQLVAGAGSFVSADAMNVYGSRYGSGSQMLAIGDSITMAFGGEYQGASQPVIPTTTAPVIVTDYAVNTSGQVTFGQAPATGATVDTSGQSAYIVRFVDDQTGGNRQTSGNSAPLEINQFMNGMYEQTGITFRTVR